MAKQEHEMTTHQKRFAAAIDLVLAIVRQHGVSCEVAGGLSTLLTCKPVLCVATWEPQTSLAIWYGSELVFQAVWIAPNEFETVVFEDGPWQGAISEMVASVLQAKQTAAADAGQPLH